MICFIEQCDAWLDSFKKIYIKLEEFALAEERLKVVIRYFELEDLTGQTISLNLEDETGERIAQGTEIKVPISLKYTFEYFLLRTLEFFFERNVKAGYIKDPQDITYNEIKVSNFTNEKPFAMMKFMNQHLEAKYRNDLVSLTLCILNKQSIKGIIDNVKEIIPTEMVPQWQFLKLLENLDSGYQKVCNLEISKSSKIKKENKNWLQIILETKKQVETEKERNSEFEEEKFARNLLTAMFFERQLETPWEDLIISLKEKEKLKYLAKLEWLFQSIGIYSNYFSKTPVDETYDTFNEFFYFFIRLGFAAMDLVTYDQIYLRANKGLLKKILEEYEEYQDFISLGKELLSMENLLVEDISNPQF